MISVKCVPQWFGYIKINAQGITWCAPFSKKIDFLYDDFTFVRIAYYTHIYKKRFFLVLSRRYLSPNQLINVNQLRSSETFVKIKITQRRFRVLSEILPNTISHSLIGAWNGDFSKGSFNIEAEMKKQAQRRRQRKKRKKR
ncbi:MAG: hypothetical protein IJX28_03405 [Clostridia bacterium]|nr:hypothetical protein [Clostridia bacterium]